MADLRSPPEMHLAGPLLGAALGAFAHKFIRAPQTPPGAAVG